MRPTYDRGDESLGSVREHESSYERSAVVLDALTCLLASSPLTRRRAQTGVAWIHGTLGAALGSTRDEPRFAA